MKHDDDNNTKSNATKLNRVVFFGFLRNNVRGFRGFFFLFVSLMRKNRQPFVRDGAPTTGYNIIRTSFSSRANWPVFSLKEAPLWQRFVRLNWTRRLLNSTGNEIVGRRKSVSLFFACRVSFRLCNHIVFRFCPSSCETATDSQSFSQT